MVMFLWSLSSHQIIVANMVESRRKLLLCLLCLTCWWVEGWCSQEKVHLVLDVILILLLPLGAYLLP